MTDEEAKAIRAAHERIIELPGNEGGLPRLYIFRQYIDDHTWRGIPLNPAISPYKALTYHQMDKLWQDRGGKSIDIPAMIKEYRELKKTP